MHSVLKVANFNNRALLRVNCTSFNLLCTKTALKLDLNEGPSEVEPRIFKEPLIRPRAKEKKPQKPPFVKNLFLGKCDPDILAYPELEKDELEYLEKSLEPISETFKLQEKRTENVLSKALTGKLSEMQLLGLKVPERMNGRQLDVTGALRFQELISESRFKEMILNNENFGIETLLKYGNDHQKSKYLSSLMSGDTVCSFCFNEPNAFWMKSMNTTAKFVDTKNKWVINGQKSWVINGDSADLFIVFAQTDENKIEHGDINVTAFIVERAFGGVNTSKCNTLNGATNMCNVDFINTEVPEENIIGQVHAGIEMFQKIFPDARLSTGIMSAVLTRELINRLIKVCTDETNEILPLAETDIAQELIAEMIVNLYAMESMIYLTSQLIDGYEDQDCELESAIVKVFSTEQCHRLSSMCMDFIGTPSIELDHWANRINREATNLKVFNESNDNLRMSISMRGIQHTGMELNEMVKKLRNPAFNVSLVLKKMWANRRQASDNPKLSMNLPQYLHPSMIMSAEALEYSILRLQYATELLLTRDGNEIVNRHMNLRRLANCAMYIYAMVASLGRASRSYCIGLQHAEAEVIMANTYTIFMKEYIKRTVLDIENSPFLTYDEFYKKIAKRGIKFKEYFPVHPLSRNF